LWADKSFPPGHVTTFEPSGSCPEGVLLDVLADIEEHHPSWSRLIVCGAHSSNRVCDALGEGVYEKTEDGFVFSR
jgi:hypothetical protein